MKISTKGRYALQLLTDLAEYSEGGYVPLSDVSERTGISKNYLEQIIFHLKDTDWLEAARGATGGYRLAKAPEAYTVADIMRVTEGSVKPDDCPEDGEVCTHSGGAKCQSLKVWRGLDNVITDYLTGISLQDVLNDSIECT
ncbi:MAG: Rrf2 family transcriptional regulator [Oscillospiraceae bacterium]|jgi:Rrf2 family protein|nr:Rrf2 family transcriptional regulator [Oscillospiraceae bacterium]